MKLRLSILTVLLLAISCEETEDKASAQPDPLVLREISTSIPDTTTNTFALLVKATVEGLTNSFAALASINNSIASLDWEDLGDAYSYTFSEGNQSITYTIFYDNPQTELVGDIAFQYSISGEFAGVTVSNFIFMSGVYLPDGSYGVWRLFGLDSNDDPYAAFEYEWSGNMFTLITRDQNGVATASYEITVNEDGSGTMTLTVGSFVSQSATWAADGSGTYTTYDSQGVPITTETW